MLFVSDVKLDIDVINGYLAEGKSVAEIREIYGIGERTWQRRISEMGYKYYQKLGRYSKKLPKKEDMFKKKANTDKNYSSNTVVIKEANIDNYDNSTKEIQVQADRNDNDIANIENLDLKKMADLIKDYDKIKKVLSWYDRLEEYDENESVIEVMPNNTINIDLDNNGDKQTSVKINKTVWNDFSEFWNKHKEFDKKDLMSMALKEYMQKYH